MRCLIVVLNILFVASFSHAGEYKVTNGTFTGSEGAKMKSEKYVIIGALQIAPASSQKVSKVPVLYPQGHKIKILSDQKKTD